jgi:hypothetical protein
MTGPLDSLKGKLPNKSSSNLIDRYSFTGDILSFKRCSMQYGKFKYYGFSKALPIQAWFGDVVHMTIEMLHRQVRGDVEDSAGSLAKGQLPSDADVEHHADNAMDILKSQGMSGSSKDERNVSELIKRFNSREGLNFYSRIVQSEVRLETIIDPSTSNDQYVLNGIIDVLRSPKKGVLEIWDYKAMVKPPKGDPKLTDLENQMYNYVEIVQALFPDDKITHAVLYFVNELEPGGSGNPQYRLDLTSSKVKQEIKRARLDADKTVDQIREAKAAGKFPFPPKGSVEEKTCDACEWRWHCPSTKKKYNLTAP